MEDTVVVYSLAQVVAESAVVSGSVAVAYDPMDPVENSAPSRSSLVSAVRWSIPCSVSPQVINIEPAGKVGTLVAERQHERMTHHLIDGQNRRVLLAYTRFQLRRTH